MKTNVLAIARCAKGFQENAIFGPDYAFVREMRVRRSALISGLYAIVVILLFASTGLSQESIRKSGPSVGMGTEAYEYELEVSEEVMAKSIWKPGANEPPISPFKATQLAWATLRQKIAFPDEEWKLESLQLHAKRDPETKHYVAFYFISFSQWKKQFYWDIPFVVLMDGKVYSPKLTRK